MSQPRRRASGAVAALVAVAGLGSVLAGCTDSGREPAVAPSSPSSPLASYDTSAISVARAPYCTQVPEAAIEEALGQAARRSRSHDNGDPVRLGSGGKDVAHEYGCTWSAGTTEAQTWLFAPPVTTARARLLIDEASSAGGCTPVPDAPAFGRPSVALVCRAGDETTASFRGLFGDAWLVCELSGRGDPAGLVERLDRWCVEVVEAARVPVG